MSKGSRNRTAKHQQYRDNYDQVFRNKESSREPDVDAQRSGGLDKTLEGRAQGH